MRHVRQILAAGWAGTTLLLAACGGGGDGAPPAAAAPAVEVAQASAMPMSADVQETGRPLDVAVLGEGLLIGHDPATGERIYTRWGRLDLDAQGRLVHAQGWHMGGVSVADATTRAGEDLAAREQAMPPVPWTMPFKADTQASLQVQFDSGRLPVDEGRPFDPADPMTYDRATSFNVIDARGHETTVTLYFRTLGLSDTGGRVAVYATLDGRPALSDAQGVWQTLAFHPDGTQVDATAAARPLRPLPGASGVDVPQVGALTVAVQATQYGAPFGVYGLTRDGYTDGRLQSVTLDTTGRIVLAYDNGQTRDHATLLVARPALSDRYRRTGMVGWQCATRCTTPVMAVPGRRLTGPLRSGALATSF